MRFPRFYPILDTDALGRAGCDPVEAAAAMLDSGAQILQFRHKEFWSRATVDLAGRIAELCRFAGAFFILNDRADYAALLRCGLHVGQDDLSPKDARLVVGPDTLVGFSTHNPQQMAEAEQEPVDYVAFGPVFQTRSKTQPDPTVGPDLLRAARALTTKPLIAIGGISRDSAGSVWDAGADSIALIADLLPSPCTPSTIGARVAEWRRLAAKNAT